MRRRYNMQRSDNFMVCSTVEILCQETEGKFFIYTGFPVKSAIAALISSSPGGELVVDTKFDQKDGFYVLYSKIERDSIVKFSYQAQ